MGRSPCCEKEGLKKGPWTPEEDQKLLAYIEQNGHGCWRSLPAKAGLQRCGKSCRLRWTNYLRPDIKRGKFSLQEEQTIIQLHALLGNRWSAIATHLPKRTDNEIKNYWNTHLKKRLAKMGIDPVTHKPRSDALASGGAGAAGTTAQHAKAAAHLSHTAQWESARLETEARLAREAKLRALAASASTSAPLHLPAPAPAPAPGGLDSPTSTLSFSDGAATLASVLEAARGGGRSASTALASVLEAAHAAAIQPVQAAFEEAFKDPQQPWGDVDGEVDAGFAAAGFTGLLHDGALSHQDVMRPAPARVDAEAEADAGSQQQQQETEEEKNYWDSILSLVNTSASASAVVPAAPEAYSPAPEF